MTYIGTPYVIKQGDTLWDIAADKLGSPTEWPRIFEFNNRAEVLKTGARKIADPDLIYAGATLRLPIVEGVPKAPQSFSANRLPRPNRLKDQLPKIVLPYSTAFELKDKTMHFNYLTYVVRIRMTGRFLITLGNPPPLTLVSNGTYEVTAKSRSDAAFTSLISESEVSIDPISGHVKYSNKMITSANNITGPSLAVGVELSSDSPIPVLKTEISYPELKGKIGLDNYVATNVKIEIEVEPRQPLLQPVPVLVDAPSAQRLPEAQTDWSGILKSASVAVVVVAAVVTVAYGASVVMSGGTTLAGSPAYATAMSALLVTGTVTTVRATGVVAN